MKLTKPQIKRQYELTYLIPSNFTDSEQTAINKEVLDLVSKNGGKVDETQSWGKKRLAYTIVHTSGKHDNAVFTHLAITFPAEKVQSFERKLHLYPKVIRHLLVVAQPEEKTSFEKSEEKVEKKDTNS